MTSHAQAHPHEKPHHPHWPLAALLFLFVFALGFLSVHEPRTWIHIKTGARILSERGVPRTDPFSYTVLGRPWTTDSWLADVLFHWVHKGFGPRGLIALKSLAAASAYALLLPLNPASPLLAASVLALGAVSAWTGFTETPAVFDWLMLALIIRILRPRRPFQWSMVAEVGFIEILWANLHGTSAVLGLWLVALKVFKASLRTHHREALHYLALIAAAALGLALNPHGLRVIAHMFDGSGFSAAAWQPLSPWLNLYTVFALAGAAACWVCLQQEFFLAMTAATLLALSLIVPDLRPLYILAACPAVALAIGHFMLPWDDTSGRVARWAAGAGVLLSLHWAGVTVPLAPSRGYAAVSVEGALNFLKANGVSGRLFNEVESGALVIGGSERPVFVDERAALYGSAFMKDALRWPQRFRQLAEVYGFDSALVLNRRGASPAKVLDEDPSWSLAYADDWTLVYLKRSSPSGGLVLNAPFRILRPNRLWPDELDAPLREARRMPKVIEELDRWIVLAPDSIQALLWKAYALERLKLSQKAERLVLLAEARPRLRRDPELMALLGFLHENRRDLGRARGLYLRAAMFARRRGDRVLEAAVLARLSPVFRRLGDEDRARALEKRAQELSVFAPAEE